MAYRALYREWRPKDFSHVVGQDAIIATLRNQVIGKRIAHAYLFCGSRGTGKTSTAKIFSKAINCLNPVNGDPCGECENCLRLEREESLDVVEIDAASNNGVDEIRNLRDTVKYPPQYGDYKVYIIDEVHMLSASAFNALLKTLEEPPSFIVFILATTEPQKLPDTILSRCQRFDFGRIPIHQITGRLREAADGSNAAATDGALTLIARAAEGGMRDALSILDMCLGYSSQVDEKLVRSILGTSDTSFLFEFSAAIAERDAGKVFLMTDRLMRDGKDAAVFARDISRHVRSLLVAKTSPDHLAKVMDITDEEASDLIRHSERFTFSRLMKILDIFMALETDMRYAATPRMALENAAVKCCLKTEDVDVQSLTDRILELEEKVGQLTEDIRSGKAAAVAPADAAAAPAGKKEGTKGSTPGSRPRKAAVKPEDPAVWKEFMAAIQKKDIMAWSFLSQGRLVGSEGRHYIWQAEKREGEQQFITALNKPDRNKAICDCLEEITGETCTFTAVPQREDPAADSGETAYIGTLYETFGQEPVQVVDDLKP